MGHERAFDLAGAEAAHGFLDFVFEAFAAWRDAENLAVSVGIENGFPSVDEHRRDAYDAVFAADHDCVVEGGAQAACDLREAAVWVMEGCGKQLINAGFGQLGDGCDLVRFAAHDELAHGHGVNADIEQAAACEVRIEVAIPGIALGLDAEGG